MAFLGAELSILMYDPAEVRKIDAQAQNVMGPCASFPQRCMCGRCDCPECAKDSGAHVRAGTSCNDSATTTYLELTLG